MPSDASTLLETGNRDVVSQGRQSRHLHRLDGLSSIPGRTNASLSGLETPRRIRVYNKMARRFPTNRDFYTGQQSSYPKTENKTGFTFIVLKPASSAVGDGPFLFAAYTRQNVLFAHTR